MKRSLLLTMLLIFWMVGMTFGSTQNKKILIAAAASLRYSYENDLIPLFEKKYPDIKVEGTYDSSGKLQSQIENGLDADIFMSASPKQMNVLLEKNLIDRDTMTELLENKIVLITGINSKTKVTDFKNILEAELIAIGDPKSVPAGQYAQEALTSLNLWKEIEKKSTMGTNVTEVLNWIAQDSAEVGIVYATDAATTDKVKVLAEVPEGSLNKKVIYPVAITAYSRDKESAKLFLEFLKSEEAKGVFKKYGFTPNK
ncbi:molybdate ABC transporter substrate-binding protein [Fusobacterium sp. PH5-44]|uniref:molybdate ABC transporter substrate-binding protein n=1 Tax=unclassified Fusobacterium TaxID=2648384 RepID=UPI003D23BFAB